MSLLAVYIHIPFCVHRCGYCDFNTYACLQSLIPAYTETLCREIELLSKGVNKDYSISTVYFGGGTPTLLPIDEMEKILSMLYEWFNFIHSPEITIEANPGTVTQDYLAELHKLKVNRISIGMQSAKEDELKLLERQHSFRDVLSAVKWSRHAGFDNLNLDLIYGMPGQKMESWLESLHNAVDLKPEHLSLYPLTVEPNTPMHRKVKLGIYKELDQDSVANMYETASEKLEKAGFHQYEISNWARNGLNNDLFSCKHNLQYWRNLPYLGLGAGAHGYINRFRTVNVLTPGLYIKKLSDIPTTTVQDGFPKTPATLEMNYIDPEIEIGETMMLGLRLVDEGVSDEIFQHRFGASLEERFCSQINRLITQGLLEWVEKDGKTLRITKRGRLLGNLVFREFI